MFPQLFGKYVLEREIAKGGMARVFLATLRGAVGFEKRLVVKQIRPELASDEAFVKRFVEEAKTAVELGHPNIVPVYELGVEQGIYYIAMDFCEGATLAEVLAETGALTPEEGAYVGIEICRALDYAHRRAGVVHRDVTPRNVMLDEEGAVRLIDFGIAAPATVEEAGRRPTEVFGSPGHMPPEQVAGSSLSPSTDVFAVAVLLAEAWTGKPPFRRATPAECFLALKTPPPSIADGHPDLEPLDELVTSSMALDPAARPETAEAFARPLREFVKSADLGDLARRLGTRVRRTRRKLLASAPWLLGEPDDSATPPPAETAKAEPRPRAPSIGDTQTFAVRDDLAEWTRKLPSVPPPEDSRAEGAQEPTTPSTRKLDAESPDPDARESQPKSSDPPRPDERSEARASRGWLAIPALLAAVALGWWGARSTLPVAEQPTRATTSAPAASEVAPAVTPSASEPMPAPSASRAPAVADPTPAPASSGAPLGSSHAPTPTASTVTVQPSGEKAVVSLTANPPSLVTLGGRSYGTTPVMGVQLPAGSYSVSFENPTLGLRAGSRITLGAGVRRSVHADFTLVTPSVTVR